MARGSESIKPNVEVDFPKDEAIALCRAGLARPVDWELPPLEGSGDEEDEEPDQFLISGVSKAAAAALHSANLHSITDVKNYLAEGKSLGDIEGITSPQIKKISELCAAE